MKDDFTLKNPRDTLYIYNISDLHWGSNYCNTNYIKHMFNEIKTRKGPVIINILGDLFECASLRVGDSAFEQIMTVNEQLRSVRKLFKPIINQKNVQLRYCVPGNHEARLNMSHFDLMEEFADSLNSYYAADTSIQINKIRDEKVFLESAEFVDKIWVNDKPLKIYGRHGMGSAKRLDLAMGKIQRETADINADIYVEGHNHRCHSYPITVKTSKDEGGMGWRCYGFTGHFLSYGGYAKKKALNILPEAYLRFTVNDVNDKLFVEGKEFFIDRYRPDLWKLGKEMI